jgi:hypothetical protein
MKPKIDEVNGSSRSMKSALDQFLKFIPLCFLIQIDELLSYGINVTVYNGQVSNSLQLLLTIPSSSKLLGARHRFLLHACVLLVRLVLHCLASYLL